MTCWDCGQRKGIHPVILQADRTVLRVCQLCWNRNWIMAMHAKKCVHGPDDKCCACSPCDHCKFCNDVLEKEKVL